MYRCLTCGFVQDFDPSDEDKVLSVHPWMLDVKNKKECPACHKYLNTHGGRKNGKVWMPDINKAGILQDEGIVSQDLLQIQSDFVDLTENRGKGSLSELRARYKNKTMFGFSVDDLISQHDEIKIVREKK